VSFLFKKKNSRYYYIGWYNEETGKRGKDEPTRKTNRKDAEKLQRLFDIKLEEKKKTVGKIADYPSLNITQAFDLFKRYKENIGKKLSPLTIESYETALNKYFIPACQDKDIKSYTRHDYNSFIKAMERRSQNTRSIYSKRINALFNWLESEQYIIKNLMRRVAEENLPIKFHTKEEIKAFLEYSDKTKFKFMTRFQLLSAFRIHEVLKVTASNIKDNHIDITGKGNKHASIPILKEMRGFLLQLPIKEPDERLFPFSQDAAWRFFTRASKKLKIKFESHDLRKYCLSEMANSGVPINFTAQYGRITIATAQKYYIHHDTNRIGDLIDSKVTLLPHEIPQNPTPNSAK
jgi:integrase